jgi:hypothetical protein
MFGVINVCNDEVLAISRDSRLLRCVKQYYERIGVIVIIAPIYALDLETVDSDGETINLCVNI